MATETFVASSNMWMTGSLYIYVVSTISMELKCILSFPAVNINLRGFFSASLQVVNDDLIYLKTLVIVPPRCSGVLNGCSDT